MLDINKEELRQRFVKKDWNYVISDLYKVCDFLLSTKFNTIGLDSEDIKQECAENFYKKVVADKVDGNKNIFSFIWQNSSFRILEIIRKHSNRYKKVQFVSLNSVDVYREKPEWYEIYAD